MISQYRIYNAICEIESKDEIQFGCNEEKHVTRIKREDLVRFHLAGLCDCERKDITLGRFEYSPLMVDVG